ncbi:unnamed protein product [Gordionus sp. m RMFG-2023]
MRIIRMIVKIIIRSNDCIDLAPKDNPNPNHIPGLVAITLSLEITLTKSYLKLYHPYSNSYHDSNINPILKIR